MAKREKKPVHKVVMTEGKRQIIQQLLQEYDIETAEDIHDALKDLLGGTIKEMMEAEMDDHLGYEKSERFDSDDYRNGYKEKTVNSSYGSMRIDVPQDRKSTFEPKVLKKRQKDISDIDQKIISMYAKGMTTRQISDTLMDIYGFEASEGFISDVTDKILPQIEDWQNWPLDDIYPILYIDAIHYSVRDNGIIRKMAAYVILGISCEGKKDVLTIEVGDNESAKYWLAVLNGLKNRGVKDILIICADGLTGIREAIQTAFPKTEYQRCIVHQVRNTLKYVSDKDRKAFANDLKTIYNAPNEEQGRANRDRITEKWSEKYPNAMKRWERDWDVITPIFEFSANVRTVIYTTNAFESLKATYRKLNRQRSVFPSAQALLKALYLATFEATKKWSMTIRNWGRFTASCRSCTKTGFSNDTINSRNGRISPSAVDMSTCIRYKISNRLKVDNAAFCKPSDIKPITGNPIYRDFFTHSTTICNSRRSLKAIFYMAIQDDCLRKNPFDFQINEVINDDTEPKVPLTPTQEKELLTFMQDDEVYSKYYDEVVILLETGLRISELCDLPPADLNFEKRFINVDH